MLEIARPTAKEGAWSAEGGGAGVHFHASTSQPDSNPMPTPIRANSLLAYLSGYTSSVVTALRRGFTQGFSLQYRGHRFFRDANNLKSAEDRPDVLTQKIAKEVAAGRIAGPFAVPPFPNVQVSPLGLVPKKEPDSFRVIHHLSFPNGNSINDGIAAHDTYVHYQNIDDAIRCIKRFGVAALMSKSYIESAFRILPVHPSDYELLGMKLDGQYYYDKALPMGCSYFKNTYTDTKYELFKVYCMPLYGSVLWDFSSRYINSFYTTWRKCIRRLFGLPARTH